MGKFLATLTQNPSNAVFLGRTGPSNQEAYPTIMRRIVAALIALSAPGVQAQEFVSPDDLLSTLYNAYLSAPVTNFEPYFSQTLTAELNGGRLDNEALLRLGFDPILGSDHPSLVTLFNLDTVDTEGLTATSVVSFKSAGRPVTITFELVREEDHGWQIDHISGQAGGVSWCSDDLVTAVQPTKGAN